MRRKLLLDFDVARQTLDALDVRSEQGHAVALDLVRGSDVFITNLHPSVLEKLRMRYEDVAALNPRLIYAHATGYGDRGAEAEKPGYDATAWWARSGMMDVVRPHGSEFSMAAAAMGDHPSSTALFGAIALALFDRERTGKGRRVRSSLLANGAWANSILLQAALCGAPAYVVPPRSASMNALVFPVRLRRRPRSVPRDGAGSGGVGAVHRSCWEAA